MTTTRNDTAAEWMRQQYDVPAQVGRRVTFNGFGTKQPMPGTIVDIPDQWLRIRLDGKRRPITTHPMWKVDYLDEVVEVEPLPMGAFAPTAEQMETAYYGVLITQLEDGDMVALTSDKRHALGAFNAYSRNNLGWENLADDKDVTAAEMLPDLEIRWVTFEWAPEDGECDWYIRDAAEGDEQAIAVVWLVI